ncbi:MFS transporter [Caenimonas terrae]|uniref:MFS transporter n=1 Tax=Caenimonas terrae TaxID=696074 RepID=A0ABW0N9X3_9BURK
MTPQAPFSSMDGLRYGLLGLPLAFVALPLYVILPNHYAREFGVPLAALGAVLLAARLFDAVIDPWIGRLNDRLFARSPASVLGLGALAALLLVAGFALLFFPLARQPGALLAWAGAALVLTYAGYSMLSVAHQSWGARLGGDEAQRGRIVAWREGLGLAGVLLASVLSVAGGPAVATAALAVALIAGWLAWARSRQPSPSPPAAAAFSLWLPLVRPKFRRLLAVFLLNGIASAIPATLVLFYVQDRLQAPAALQPAFLGCYFLCAALAMPLWLAAVRRIGLARSWLCGMALSIAVFAWAALLGAGDSASFLAVCALSGAALGADLALPGALLAGLIADAGERGRAEGAYFGWWNFATKLNLALAAGLALPLLALAGYSPGARDGGALGALVFAYCVLPCVLKLLAAATLYLGLIRPERNR